jgi:hypothetical protein
MSARSSPPLFILSPRHRDALSRLAESAGWQPVAARRTAHAESRFVVSGANIAIVDARGAYAEGLEGVRALAARAEVNSAALIVLVSRADAAGLDELFARAPPLPGCAVHRPAVCAGARFAALSPSGVGGAHRRLPRCSSESPQRSARLNAARARANRPV